MYFLFSTEVDWSIGISRWWVTQIKSQPRLFDWQVTSGKYKWNKKQKALSSKDKNVFKMKAQNKQFQLIFNNPNLATCVTHYRRISFKCLRTSHISGWSGSQVHVPFSLKSSLISKPTIRANFCCSTAVVWVWIFKKNFKLVLLDGTWLRSAVFEI